VSGPLDNFLERFRRTGGVPAAVGGDLAEELRPVFAALDEFEGEADAMRRRAEAEGQDRKASAARELAEIAADARVKAERARGEAYEAALAAAEAQARAIVSDGEQAAAVLYERGSGRLPALVDEIVARLSESVR